MVKLAEHNLCTGCGACAHVCAKSCITMKEDDIGIVFPIVDETNCISCKRCENICPILNPLKSTYPQKAYAAWSKDAEERRTSASGGIAAELYKMAIAKGYKVVGASQNKDFSVTHKMASTLDEIVPFKNSKYVFSDAYDVFGEIGNSLKKQDKVLFIGLPCQVAALKKIYKDNENLLLVEVICHGTTPFSYLKQHIEKISKEYGQCVKRMSFRDEDLQTYTYTFTLYDCKGNRFYAKQTKDGDSYQFGYHRAVTYRENCYYCSFAKSERNSDITIADYHGLGLVAPAEFSAQKVSLILENSKKGKDFLKLLNHSSVYFVERPIEEPMKGEAQLNHPSVKSKFQKEFAKNIVFYKGDFEQAIKSPQKKYFKLMFVKKLMDAPKKIIKKALKLLGVYG